MLAPKAVSVVEFPGQMVKALDDSVNTGIAATVKLTGISEEAQPVLELACAYSVACTVPFSV